MARRPSARAAKHAQRARPPEINPCPPGSYGGQYKPLTDAQVQRIYTEALRILEQIGMADVPPVLLKQALGKGAKKNSLGRLSFPAAMVEDIVAGACKTFTFYGRDPKHDIQVGKDRVYFGTGGAAVQTLDFHTGQYRPSTLADLYDFTRLVDQLPNVSWFTRCCIATDITDFYKLDINTAYALLRGTIKPVATAFTVADAVDPIIDMFDMAMGGKGMYAQKPFCKAHISPVISPLKYGDDAVQVALACMRRGVPISNIVAAMTGATSPAPLAGTLAMTLAETLAALLMINVFEPGYPMIFSNWPLVIDLRTGAFRGGSGEMALLNAASAQLSNSLGLPSGCAASMSDAKVPDAQMGMEKALTALSCGLAGGNMVYESSGMMASLLGVSMEAFVMDNEMLSHVQRCVRGIEVDEEHLGFDSILAAVTGAGHFIDQPQTMLAMERDYYYPTLADRQEPVVWQAAGSLDHWQRARAKVEELLQHQPNYLDKQLDRAIRNKYPILATIPAFG
ncbi:MAG: trimethylamine methyltransferase family protein [Gammaproteobacteria bacterium]|jgi:trimethylamine--corrinoid protein Co-methyltransferase|nr:trimethylamine methyltransferase family protein [Gammaproteobacteria bacterium]